MDQPRVQSNDYYGGQLLNSDINTVYYNIIAVYCFL